MMMNKIKTLEQVSLELKKLKGEGKTIIHCHGVFDLLHPGHLHHFQSASELGDILVVTTSPDHYVNKGPGRPVFNQRLRAEFLAALEIIDYVAINETPSAVETILLLKPNIYVKGIEYKNLHDLTGHIAKEKKAVLEVGGELVFVGDTAYSSTTLINQYFSILTPQTQSYLAKFKESYNIEYILGQIDLLEKKKVLIVGETIIDEYLFCQSLGISNKSSCIDARYLEKEIHLGGAAGIAKHLAGFCQEVHFVTYLEKEGEHVNFVRNNLDSSVNFKPMFTSYQSSVTKQRFLTNKQKPSSQIFELTKLNIDQTKSNVEHEMCLYLNQVACNYDLVIVADYGYNAIGDRLAKNLCELNTYLTISAQTNSYNLGSNLLTKYSKADYICADIPELRLALGHSAVSNTELVLRLSNKLHCPFISITLGDQGSLNWSEKKGFFESTAFTTEVVDAIGASSAYFGITSLCANSGFSPMLVGFIGNSVGAMMVRTLGHREYISSSALKSFIIALLK